MPRDFGINSYMTQLISEGHQAPPWETWASEIHADPIPVLRISENIEKWEETHHRTCPPGLIIAWARVQGLEPAPEQVQALLDERKAWRGHRAEPEPGPQAYQVTISVVPPAGGTVEPPGGIFDSGAVVVFTAIPVVGYLFERWTGDYTGTNNPITVTIDSDKNITARFRRTR